MSKRQSQGSPDKRWRGGTMEELILELQGNQVSRRGLDIMINQMQNDGLDERRIVDLLIKYKGFFLRDMQVDPVAVYQSNDQLRAMRHSAERASYTARAQPVPGIGASEAAGQTVRETQPIDRTPPRAGRTGYQRPSSGSRGGEVSPEFDPVNLPVIRTPPDSPDRPELPAPDVVRGPRDVRPPPEVIRPPPPPPPPPGDAMLAVQLQENEAAAEAQRIADQQAAGGIGYAEVRDFVNRIRPGLPQIIEQFQDRPDPMRNAPDRLGWSQLGRYAAVAGGPILAHIGERARRASESHFQTVKDLFNSPVAGVATPEVPGVTHGQTQTPFHGTIAPTSNPYERRPAALPFGYSHYPDPFKHRPLVDRGYVGNYKLPISRPHNFIRWTKFAENNTIASAY